MDRNGTSCELELEDTLAIAACHEIDHLNGIIYVEKTLPDTFRKAEENNENEENNEDNEDNKTKNGDEENTNKNNQSKQSQAKKSSNKNKNGRLKKL